MSQSTVQLQNENLSTNSGGYSVVLHNDDHTPYALVVQTLMVATGCPKDEAEIETWEAHHFGKSQVHFSGQSECEAIASVIGRAGIVATVEPEWND
ncbi:MAG: ATP-dependent Clp protease adaptor ClpS [Armatimonadetes bacterium]|nr:ATP-dependent Clp protease adaptor ClpS [Armatimonadota bacterium]